MELDNRTLIIELCTGINVNATDNVGWTPLHEASNHGNTECVRELLKFIPAKTMDVFLTKGNS